MYIEEDRSVSEILVSKADEDERNEDALQWIIGISAYGDALCARDKGKGMEVSKAKRECLLAPCMPVGPGSGWVLDELPASRLCDR